MKIYNFFLRHATSKEKARQIRSNPELAPKSFRFGMISIIQSIVAFALSLVAIIMRGIEIGPVNSYIILAIVVLVSILSPIVLIANAIANFIMQLSINRNWSTWTSLVLIFLSIAGTAVIVLFGFNMF